MEISRRRTIQSMLVFAGLGSTAFSQEAIMAQEVATPAGTPVVSDPQTIFDLLLATPVETPLFPGDTGPVSPVLWQDEGDDDLIGTIGGVLMQTGQDENQNFIGPGVYIVYPDADTPLTRLNAYRLERLTATPGVAEESVDSELTSIEIAGYSGTTISEPDGIVTLIAVGPVLISAFADHQQPGDPALRSLVNCVALIDHLQTVMSFPES